MKRRNRHSAAARQAAQQRKAAKGKGRKNPAFSFMSEKEMGRVAMDMFVFSAVQRLGLGGALVSLLAKVDAGAMRPEDSDDSTPEGIVQ